MAPPFEILHIKMFCDYLFFDLSFQNGASIRNLYIKMFCDYSFFDLSFQKWRLHSKFTYQNVLRFIFRCSFPKWRLHSKIQHVQISLNSRISFAIIHFSILLSKMAPPFEILHIKMFCDYSFLDPLFQKWRLHSKIYV